MALEVDTEYKFMTTVALSTRLYHHFYTPKTQAAKMATTNATCSSSNLFEPLQVGRSTLQHRIVMAPLTRYRATDDHVHTDLAVTYYTQRSSTPGTLLITEGTYISPRATGYTNAPGLWNDEQLRAWKKVTDAVHANGSFIYAQLWALGRAADASVLKIEYGHDVVSSSDIALPVVSGSYETRVEGQPAPRPLSEEEIWQYVADYATAAKNAVEIAGFDGVEVHGANGYLVDQFIQDVSNRRTDAWGGSIENRSRFAIEVVQAISEAVGPDRTAIRLSPFSTYNSMRMADDKLKLQYTHLIKELSALKLAYLHLIEGRISGNLDIESEDSVDFALEAWGKERPVLLAGGYTPARALHTVDEQRPDSQVAIVFGRYFVSNLDLVFRVKKGIELSKYDRNTFYTPKIPEGYVDYPFADEFKN
jgi:NADPH2 dehydrogenase